MNATQQSPAIFLLEARSWPSALSSYLEDGTLCCMLHTSVKFGVGITTGCYNWNPGTHKSIQALYSGISRGQVCFAMDGQLVLDRQVAREAVDMRNSCCTALGAGGGMGLKYRKGLDIGVSAYGSGYCYLTAFAPGVRSRVARILGPLPLIADVLRMLRIFGDQYISARWQKIADGVYHVVPVKLSEAIPPKTFFLQGWNIMRDESETARVGVEFSHQYASYFAYKIQQISSVVGDILCLGVQDEIDVDERVSDETGWLLRLDDVQDQTIVDLALDHANIDSKGKVACSDCGFYVNPLGHELRCFKKITANDNSSFRFWSAAWMGDVVHRRDVRLYVLISDTPKERMGDYEETFVRKEAQAAFYMSYPGPKVPARGSSVHSISSAFEASYRGSFRADYIRSMFGKLTVEQLPEYLRPFTKGL